MNKRFTYAIVSFLFLSLALYLLKMNFHETPLGLTALVSALIASVGWFALYIMTLFSWDEDER